MPNLPENFGKTLSEELWGNGEPMDAGIAIRQSLRDAQPGKIGQGSCLRPRLQTGFALLARVQESLWCFAQLFAHAQFARGTVARDPAGEPQLAADDFQLLRAAKVRTFTRLYQFSAFAGAILYKKKAARIERKTADLSDAGGFLPTAL